MSTWGIIPAAGFGSRGHATPFSQELMPVGDRTDGEADRPRVVAEYLLERMTAGGATKICFVLSPGKSDIVDYFGGRVGNVDIAYLVESEPSGLCAALFRAASVVAANDRVLIGLPETIWFPIEGFKTLPDAGLSFLLFPAAQPQCFDAVVTDGSDEVLEVQVKHPSPRSRWIWGGIKMDAATFHALHELWREPGRNDESVGTLVNAYLARGGRALGLRGGLSYVDLSTHHGYREALQLLGVNSASAPPGTAAEAARYTDGWRPLTVPDFAHAYPSQRVEVDALYRSAR